MNNNIKFAVAVEVIEKGSFYVENAEVVVFESAQEAIKAFEAAETAATLIVVSADMNDQVRKDLGAVQAEDVTIWEGRSQWYHQNPMTWVARKGNLGYWSFRKGFVALMRAE